MENLRHLNEEENMRSETTTPQGISLSKVEMERIERALLRERERALRVFARHDLRSSPGTEPGRTSIHLADQASDAVERETRFLLTSKEGRYLYRIEDALRRLYREPECFGQCATCGERIPIERLEALPHVRYCLPCKLREEEAQSAA
jgi:DnaK suppressor protein